MDFLKKLIFDDSANKFTRKVSSTKLKLQFVFTYFNFTNNLFWHCVTTKALAIDDSAAISYQCLLRCIRSEYFTSCTLFAWAYNDDMRFQTAESAMSNLVSTGHCTRFSSVPTAINHETVLLVTNYLITLTQHDDRFAGALNRHASVVVCVPRQSIPSEIERDSAGARRDARLIGSNR